MAIIEPVKFFDEFFEEFESYCFFNAYLVQSFSWISAVITVAVHSFILFCSKPQVVTTHTQLDSNTLSISKRKKSRHIHAYTHTLTWQRREKKDKKLTIYWNMYCSQNRTRWLQDITLQKMWKKDLLNRLFNPGQWGKVDISRQWVPCINNSFSEEILFQFLLPTYSCWRQLWLLAHLF